jgi:hypothetical protein
MGPIPASEQPSQSAGADTPFAVPGEAGTVQPYTGRLPGGKAERRQCLRRELSCDLLLIDDITSDPADTPAVPGTCLDVSDGGLYATVPLGYGVAIGQRYTFRLMVSERGPEPGAIQIVSQQGIIVRTELLVGYDESGDRLGIGVKLSGHRSGVVPMPSYE